MTLNANPSLVSLVAPVSRLFASNDEPTPQERILVTAAISAAEQEVSLRRFSSTPDRKTWYQQDAALESFLRVHKALLSSVRLLPFEILVIILTYVANDPNVDLHNPPYRLGHVCRLWRNVCLSIPEIHCVLPPLRLTKRNKKLDVGQHLTTTLVSVSFQLGGLDSSGLHPAALWYFKSSGRWKSVSLQLHRSSFQAISSKILNRVSRLETLHLDIKHKPQEMSRQVGSLDAFQDAPALHDVHIECMVPIFLKLPWKQLKRYRERSSHPIGIVPALRDGALSLECLTWIGIHSGPNPLPTLNSLVPYRLTHLDLVMYGGSLHTIINMIDTPKLQELRVRDTVNPNALTDITSMLRRSFAGISIRCLSLYTGPPRQDRGCLADLLRRMPQLVELECNNLSTEDLKQVLGDASGGSLVPHLQKLVVYDPVELILPIVNQIIDQRSRPLSVQLEVVRLVFANEKACDSARCNLDIVELSNKKLHKVFSKFLSELAGLVEFYQSGGLHGPVQPLTEWRAEVKLHGVLTGLENFEIKDPNMIEVRPALFSSSCANSLRRASILRIDRPEP
ncbi:unnamed protein product [Cyclocybe aegerita]|uniref:F-box domain-containing protein n=1 Tax=Cyclocybe aegerita TaxID=1973307 RepID=A0A8S0W078_CYCAE|nr:unnamed protein product [Cyclocybe aegerita]